MEKRPKYTSENAFSVIYYFDMKIFWLQRVLPVIFVIQTVVLCSLGNYWGMVMPVVMSVMFTFMPAFMGIITNKFIYTSWWYAWLFRYRVDLSNQLHAFQIEYSEDSKRKRAITYDSVAEILMYCEKAFPRHKWFFNDGHLYLAKKSQLIKLKMMFTFLNEEFYGKM